MSIFAVTSVILSQCRVETDARYHAWKYRHTPWHAGATDPTNLGVSANELQIVDGQTRVPASHVVYHEAAKPVQQFLADLVPNDAQATHYVYAGCWDHREIKFDRHDRLRMMDKVNFFSNADLPLSIFRPLSGR